MFRRFEFVALVALVLGAMAVVLAVQQYVYTSGSGLPLDLPLACEECGNRTLTVEGDEFRCGQCRHVRWLRTPR